MAVTDGAAFANLEVLCLRGLLVDVLEDGFGVSRGDSWGERRELMSMLEKGSLDARSRRS